ncbi:MAG: class I SAM-dependent methyltransferase [Balneolia bacterium]|nr:class I SAM-dependent methyltransferase [Balneolia bacterium]
MVTNHKCPLCGTENNLKQLDGQDIRVYSKCPECTLIFVRQEDLPAADEEKSRYLEHNNGIEYPGYVKFLNQAIQPALPFLKPGGRGLDFGCGPVPTLNILMEREGFTCENYDPFFVPDKPDGPYDFIFSTESFEHFFDPAKEIEYVSSLLKPGGLLTIMTVFWKSESDLIIHYYFRDPSHVVFYHTDTIEWIAKNYGYDVVYSDEKRVVILRKTEPISSVPSGR